MRTSTLHVLSAPQLRASVTRTVLVATGTAAAGGLLMVSAALFRVPATALPPRSSTVVQPGGFSYDSRYAGIVTSAETRIGVVTAVLLLAGTALVLAWQAVTSGSARRGRRSTALAVAGATPGQLRALAAAEAAAGGLAGGLLAGPVYLVLWVLLGPAQPAVSRLLPGLALSDVAVWAFVVLGTTAAAAVAGALTALPGRQVARRRRGWWWLAPAALGLAAVFLGVRISETGSRQVGVALVCAAISLLLLAALASGAPWVRSRARRMARGDDPLDVLAAGGLQALASSAGRSAGVLLGVGMTLGVAAVLTGNALRQTGQDSSQLRDQLPGIALATAAATLAALAALATLTLAAVDDLLSTSRGLAAMSAVGADLSQVQTLLGRRLRAATIAPLVTGLLMGGIGYGALGAAGEPDSATDAWPLLLVAPAAVGLLVAASAGISRLLRARTRDAVDPTNLRVA